MVKIKEIYKERWHDPKQVNALVKKHLKSKSLNFPCGMSKLGDIRADIDPTVKPDIITDMYNPNITERFDSIYCDPPWNIPYDKRIPLVYKQFDLLKPNGRLIYNAPWIPNCKGFYIENIFLTIPTFMMGNVACITILKKANGELDIR
jgi:hypothetical protein